MTATILKVSNPFDPIGSRTVTTLKRSRRISALAPAWDSPFIAVLNGQPQMRAQWRRKVKHGDVLVFTRLPRGGNGGNGGDGSNVMLVVAMIAISVAAPYVGTAAAGALGLTGTAATIGASVASTAFMMAASALVNGLIGQPAEAKAQTPSPTYSLNAQGNSARIEAPIPIQYGEMQFYPDLCAQPWAEFSGSDQYVYQLFCLGRGHFDVSNVWIEDTPIENFAEVEYEIVPPGQKLDLFPASVNTSVEVSGQQFLDNDAFTWTRVGTTATLVFTGNSSVGFELATGSAAYVSFSNVTVPANNAYTIQSVSNGGKTVTITVANSGATSGTGTLSHIIGDLGGFTANSAGTEATHVAFDLVGPRGLYGLEDDGDLTTRSVIVRMQVKRINDNGEDIGSWTDVATKTITGRTVTPIRKSFKFKLANLNLPAGRYKAQAWRLDDKSDNNQDGHDVAWAGLRTYLQDDNRFGDVTVLGVKMLATNNLSMQASRKIKVKAARKIPVWNGSSWSAPVATRSIAWALADVARANYGANMGDSKIDLASLLALDAIWASRGDSFDARFETETTAWQALQSVAFAGRARAFMQGGKLRFVRDGATTTPVALFSMRNIVKGSFGIDYVFESETTSDVVEVSYLDESTWQPQRLTCSIRNSTDRPTKMDLFGITNRKHAQREGFYHAASNFYRRRVVRFETELDAMVCTLGDLIAIQHDAPGWGQHAEAVGWDSGTKILTLSERITFGSSGRHYIGVRTSQGGMAGPYEVQAVSGQEYQIKLLDDPIGFHTAGVTRERTHIVFGGAQSYRTLAKVTSIRPKGLHRVAVEAITEDPTLSVHTSENGRSLAPVSTSILPKVPTGPVVTGLQARQISSIRVSLAWNPAPGANTYELSFAHGNDPDESDLHWTGAAVTHNTTHTTNLAFGAKTIVRLRALGIVPGPWIKIVVADLLGYMWSVMGSGQMWNTDNSVKMWSPL